MMAPAFPNRIGRKSSPPSPAWMTAAPELPVVMDWACRLFAAYFTGMAGRRFWAVATSWAEPGSAWSGPVGNRPTQFCEPVLAASPDVTNLYRTATEPLGRLVNNRKRKG